MPSNDDSVESRSDFSEDAKLDVANPSKCLETLDAAMASDTMLAVDLTQRVDAMAQMQKDFEAHRRAIKIVHSAKIMEIMAAGTQELLKSPDEESNFLVCKVIANAILDVGRGSIIEDIPLYIAAQLEEVRAEDAKSKAAVAEIAKQLRQFP